MEHETVTTIALFSGILGFVVFCASYTFHVWRSRNAAMARTSAPNRSLSVWAARLFCAMFVIGCLMFAVIPIMREFTPREGLLSGDGLFTVRADERLRLEYVTQNQVVEADDVLACFRSPDHQARIKELTLKRQILEAQKRVIQRQPLTPDHEIVRRYQQADADRRQLFASWLHLIPERAVVARELVRDRLDRIERINSLDTQIETSRWQLDQATAELERERRHAQRYKSLAEQSAATRLECEDQATEVAVLNAEVARLQRAIECFSREKESIADGLPQYRAVAQEQLEQLDHEAEQARKEMADAESARQTLTVQLDQDRERATQLRRHRLEQIDLEIQQCAAGLEGLEGTLTIRAPFRGRVAYADPAPRTTLPREPVVVLSPEEGFRLKLRLPESEIRSLSAAETVTLALVDPSLRRRFPGRLLEWEPLPHEPGYTLAQLTCLPPTDTIRELTASEGEAIKVRLVWRPPLYAVPFFPPAVGLMALGAIGWAAAKMAGARRRTVAQAGSALDLCAARSDAGSEDLAEPAVMVEKETEATPWPEPARDKQASGAIGAQLQLLGQELRNSIKRNAVDPSVLGTIEAALDRNQACATPFLLQGLDHDPELPACLAAYLRRPAGKGEECGASHDCETGSTRYRLLNILRVMAPELVPPLACRTASTTEVYQGCSEANPWAALEPMTIHTPGSREQGR